MSRVPVLRLVLSKFKQKICRIMKVLSLFSGAGGLDIGFHKAGFDIVACVEIEKIFCQTLAKNAYIGKYLSPNCQIFNQDIIEFDVNRLPTSQIDFVIGGPPCQTYSASGRRIGGAPGIEDERGRLFEYYCAILSKLQPRGFLFENVRGLLGVNKGAAWKAVVAAFSDLGYNLSYQILDSAAYGVPQHRERVILVGTRQDDSFLFPRPIFGPDSKDKKPYVTAGEVLLDLQNANEPYHEYDGKYGFLLSGIPEGMNYSFYTAEMGHPEPVFAWRSKFSSFLYKVAQDKPVKTIQAQLGKFAGPFHWKNRRLTVAELKRLQSFPDDYEFCGSYEQISRQIGNSVPPLLAEFLAKAVAKQLFSETRYPDLELMPEQFQQTFDARKGAKAARTREVTKRTKVSQINSQMTLPLFEENSNLCEVPIFNQNFYLCYDSPVNKQVILEKDVISNVAMNNAKIRFKVEDCAYDKTTGKLQVQVCNLSKSLSQPLWKLCLKLFQPLSSGITGLEVFLCSDKEEHIFVAWDAAEEIIKRNSSFISLVAIHGHFAEPKIKYSLSIESLAVNKSPFARAVCFFSKIENCGKNIIDSEMAVNLNLQKDEIKPLLRRLRDVRYDIRSQATAPRIPENYFFCAYPFPELNANYQIKKPL